MPSKQMKIIFFCVEAVGHVNACIGIAKALANRGHRIHFISGLSSVEQLQKLGFEVFLIEKPMDMIASKDSNDKNDHPMKKLIGLIENFKKIGVFSNKSSSEKLRLMVERNDENIWKISYDEIKALHPKIDEIIKKESPDLIVIDHFFVPPCIVFGETPWAFLFSENPLYFLKSENLPPKMSGLPTNDQSKWGEFKKVLHETYDKIVRTYQNQLNQDFGYPETSSHDLASKFLNIYGYPKELDYSDIVTIPENYVRFDAFHVETPEVFEFPDEFRAKIKPNDKLVYVSLGSMGSVDVELMKRLVDELKNTPHKYIISKGPLSEKYELAENMWGAAFLPQTKILPLVDLVVTHGGNNTTTETFISGKPMVVMPMFADQFDNAQRVQEKAYGMRINPYDFKDGELRKAIDQILEDEAMLERCRKVRERMSKSQDREKACIKIEKILESLRSD